MDSNEKEGLDPNLEVDAPPTDFVSEEEKIKYLDELEAQIQGQIIDTVKDTEIFKALDILEIPEDIQQQVDEAIRSDEDVQQELDNISDQLIAEIKDNDLTVGESLDIISNALQGRLQSVMSSMIPLAINAAKIALNSDLARDLLEDYAKEKFPSLAATALKGYFLGNHETKTYDELSLIASVIAPFLDRETWLALAGTVTSAVSTIGPLLESPSMIGAIETIANQAGWLTSHGAPFNVIERDIGGGKYLGCSVNGVTFLFDVNPTLSRVPLILTVDKTIPPAVGLVTRKFGKAVNQIVRAIYKKINNGASTWVASHYDVSTLSQLGLSDEKISTLAQRLFNYVKGQTASIKPILPDIQVPEDVPKVDEEPTLSPMDVINRFTDAPDGERFREERSSRAGSLYPYVTRVLTRERSQALISEQLLNRDLKEDQ